MTCQKNPTLRPLRSQPSFPEQYQTFYVPRIDHLTLSGPKIGWVEGYWDSDGFGRDIDIPPDQHVWPTESPFFFSLILLILGRET